MHVAVMHLSNHLKPVAARASGSYYVVAEALTNAAKHARASVVDVCIAVADGNLRLTIQGDGTGGADAGRGSGLTGLTDRVEALGGKMRFASQPGQGTELHVEFRSSLSDDDCPRC
jgi:signal transduction histidine kinase